MADEAPDFDSMKDEAPDFDSMQDQGEKPTALGKAVEPITSIPSTYQKMVKDSISQMGEGAHELYDMGAVKALKGAGHLGAAFLDPALAGTALQSQDATDVAKSMGKIGLGAAGYVAAPIAAPLHTIVGKPVAENTGSEFAGNLAETAAGFALPVPKGIPKFAKVPGKFVEEAAPATEFGIPRTRGQTTGDRADIDFEGATGRGAYGDENQRRAQEFYDKQQEKIEDQRSKLPHPLDMADTIAEHLRNTALDQNATEAQRAAQLKEEHEKIRADLGNGRVVAESPQEASDVISASVTRAEEEARAARDKAYQDFREQQGFFEPQVFNNVERDIRASLNKGEPVALDSKTTPVAVQAIRDVGQVLGAPAKAALDPAVKSFKPFTPQTIDDVRKRLVAFNRQANDVARSTGNFSDVRAMGRVMQAFDDIVQRGLRNPKLFSGDGAAVADAISNAHMLHSNLRAQFSKSPNDAVSGILQQIVGRGNQSAPANQIRGWLYGNSKTTPQVAAKLMEMFGESSPEGAALKQGYFSHLTEPAEGVVSNKFDPEAVANRIGEALNGKGREVSREYFNGYEQQRLREYADRLRASVKPKPAPTDAVSEQLEKIIGQGGQGTTSAELANTLFGRSGTGENATGVKVAQHIKKTYGEDSVPFNAVRAGQLSKLMEGSPADVARKIKAHFDGNGRPMADTLWDGMEENLLRRYGDFMETLVIPKGSYFPSAPPVQGAIAAAASKVTRAVAAGIGAVIAHALLPFSWGVSELAGAGAGHLTAKTVGKISERKIAQKVADHFPVVSNNIKRWQNATVRANGAYSQEVAAATNALNRALLTISPNLSLRGIVSQVSGARADENKKNKNPEPEIQLKDDGTVNKKPVFRAHGGRVNGDSNPPVTGARLAPDGEWYVPDPYREKKYLRVVARGGSR